MPKAEILTGSYAYVTTIGRRTGKTHVVELWFVAEGRSLYFLAHKDSNWWKNIRANPNVEVGTGKEQYSGKGGIAQELRDQVFEMFRKKYGRSQVDEWYGGARGDRVVVEITLDEE